eukprot:scaffold150606_cov21-Tisochrysis_lutea.AAC.1
MRERHGLSKAVTLWFWGSLINAEIQRCRMKLKEQQDHLKLVYHPEANVYMFGVKAWESVYARALSLLPSLEVAELGLSRKFQESNKRRESSGEVSQQLQLADTPACTHKCMQMADTPACTQSQTHTKTASRYYNDLWELDLGELKWRPVGAAPGTGALWP